jgi:hypothetical protein
MVSKPRTPAVVRGGKSPRSWALAPSRATLYLAKLDRVGAGVLEYLDS